jgi:hypothetical protein
VGGIFTPLAALFAGWVATLFTWLAGTWLGTLLMPVYSMLAPLILKVTPWITMSKFGRQLYDWLDDQPWWPQALVLTGPRQKKKKPGTKPAPKRQRRGAQKGPRR